MSDPQLLISGFADEAVRSKRFEEQLGVMAALGLRYLALRFLDVGQGIKNVLKLTDDELLLVAQALTEYDMQISSLGSPLGKIKLIDQQDGTNNLYRPIEDYLQEEVVRTCQIANRLGTKLIRGFSFYHPPNESPENYLDQATDYVGRIAEVCRSHGLIYGLEVEANLVGQNGWLLAKIHQAIANESLVLIFDGGNLVMQGYDSVAIFEQYRQMRPGLGWIHLKDFAPAVAIPTDEPAASSGHTYVDEESVKDFVPVDLGGSAYRQVLEDLRVNLPTLHSKMIGLGAAGFFADLEPHLKGGGQFGGFSGPDGMGVAMRAFCRLCDETMVAYRIREFSDIRLARGF